MSDKPKILLVDDSPQNLQILVAALKDEYRLLVATNGTKALGLAGRDPPPDMVLLDVMMPDVNGYEVCERLKAEPATRDIPVIFVTARAEAGDEERGLGLGAVDYITKPISPSIVRARIRTQLALRRSMEELQQAYGIIQAQKERMQKELNVGHEIQMSMLPVSFPQCDELEVHAALEPAREVGGDFYDCFFIDAQRLCFCIGDVSDKGVPSALLMAMAKTMIKSRAGADSSTAGIMNHVNQELCADNDACMFVTLFLGILDLSSGALTTTNAGHNPPLIRHADGSSEWLARRDGPAAGSFPGARFREGSTRLAPGDILLLYTDGVTEADDGSDNLFGAPRLQQLLEASDAASMDALVGEIRSAVKAFEAGAPQADDITVLALRFRDRDAGDEPFQIAVPNESESLLLVCRDFDSWAEQRKLPGALRNQVQMAFDELLSNILSYAYEDEERHQIRVLAELQPERLLVQVEDDGRPFDPFSLPEPDLNLAAEDREPGGLGIHLLRTLFDRAGYERVGGCNRVRLEKQLIPSSG